VLVFRGIERIGKSIRTSPRDALIAASADKSVRGKAFGFQRMLDSFGAILGPIIAYFVFALLGSGENAYRGIFYAALIPAFLAVLIIILFVREPKGKVSASTNKADAKDKPNFLQSISMLGREHKRFILVSCIFSLAYFSFAMLILRANDIGILAQDILLVYVIYNVVHALASMPVGQLSDRIGRKPVIAFEFLLYAGICVGFAFVSNLWQVALLFAAYGVFVAIDDSVSKAYISDISEDKTRGIALGSYYTAVGIVYLPASVLFGVAWAALGPTTSFLGAAAIAVLASVAMVVYTK